MRLLCPNCQKELQVPDQYAGQLMKCPLCAGNFSVPTLAQIPGGVAAPPPPPPLPAEMPVYRAPEVPQAPTPAPVRQPAVPAAPPPPPPPPGSFGHNRSYEIHAKLIAWIAPLSLLIVVGLMFMPWVGMYPGGQPAVTQDALNIAFGGVWYDKPGWYGYSTNEKPWSIYYAGKIDDLIDPGIGLLMIFFIVAVLLALVLALASAAFSFGLLPVPAGLLSFWGLRSLFIGLLSLAALVLLGIQVYSGFPLEKVAASQVAKEVEAKREATTATGTKNDAAHWAMEEGIRLAGYQLSGTIYLRLVVALAALATIGAFLDFWLMRRGNKPLPRMDLYW